MIRVHIIGIGRFKSKMTVLQNNYGKMTILWSFSYNSFVIIFILKNRSLKFRSQDDRLVHQASMHGNHVVQDA